MPTTTPVTMSRSVHVQFEPMLMMGMRRAANVASKGEQQRSSVAQAAEVGRIIESESTRAWKI